MANPGMHHRRMAVQGQKVAVSEFMPLLCHSTFWNWHSLKHRIAQKRGISSERFFSESVNQISVTSLVPASIRGEKPEDVP